MSVDQSVAAQRPVRGPGAAALDPLFQQVLRQPSDLETNLAFARRAFDLGDYEASAATLERLLIANPDRPVIRIELAALYLRLGAPERATAYVQQALETGQLTPEIEAKGRDLLAAARAASRKGRLSGALDLFGGHQSNAVSRPGPEDLLDAEAQRRDTDPTYPALTSAEAIPDTNKPDSDGNYGASLRFGYTQELAGQVFKVASAQFTHYVSRQNDDALESLNVSNNGLQLAATLRLSDSFIINPNVSTSYLNTADIDQFVRTNNVGVTMRGPLGQRAGYSLTLATDNLRYASKNNKQEATELEERNGTKIMLKGDVITTLGQRGRLQALFDWADMDAAKKWESYSVAGLGLNYSHPYRGTLVSASASWRQTTRDAISPSHILQRIREDDDTTLTLSAQRRVMLGLSLGLSVSHFERSSNFPNFSYTNESASLSLSRSF